MKSNEKLSICLDIFVRQIAKISPFIQETGLLSGKTGVTILLYEYARYKNDPEIKETANRLLDMIVQEIGIDSGLDLDRGLCGIAWGIRYLISREFVQEEEDVLREVDAILFQEIDRPFILQDFPMETDNALYALISLTSCRPDTINIWRQRIDNCMRDFQNILLQRYRSIDFPAFPCRNLIRFFHLAKTLFDRGQFCREISSLYEELPEFVKLSLKQEQCLSDKCLLTSLFADIPLFDRFLRDDYVPQAMTLTDTVNYNLTRLLLDNAVSIPGFADENLLSIAANNRKADELLYQLNPNHAGLESGATGFVWSLLQWCIKNNPLPVNEKQILTIDKNRHDEVRKRQTLDLIPKLKPLENNTSPQFIVSMTSYGKRLAETAPFAIISLLNQTVKPDRMVLWVAREDRGKIPQVMVDLISKGLEIHFCDDVKSYKKLVFALEMYPDDYIITADDDIFFPQNWFERLLNEHKKNPKKIICHRAHGIKVDGKRNPLPYSQWDKSIEPCSYFSTVSGNSHQPASIFPTGGAGTLFPPKCFHGDVTNRDLFMKLAPKADDIWFWTMAVINKGYFGNEIPFVVIENGYSDYLHVIDSELQQGENALWNYNSQGGNDRQLKEVITFYPQVKDYLNKIEPAKAADNNMETFSSEEYWEDRYAKGGDSGAGSYYRLAQFKAEIINDFVKRNAINSVIEFGCGDGNQLSLIQYPDYTGFDVSETAINLCRQKFVGDHTKQFRLMSDYKNETAELTLSLDVIYHLIEDDDYENYMKMLFHASTGYVVVYASNKTELQRTRHVKHRIFTDWIKDNLKNWKLLQFIPNRYPATGDENDPATSFSDFYVFGKKNSK